MSRVQAPDRIDEAFQECARLRDPDGDPELEAVRAALFVEDALTITLADADIDPDLLGSPLGLRAVVARRGGTA